MSKRIAKILKTKRTKLVKKKPKKEKVKGIGFPFNLNFQEV